MKPSNFEMNKIIGAILLASIIAMVSGFVAMGLYTGSIAEHGGHDEEKRGYSIAVAEDTSSEGGEVVEDVPVDIMPYMANADIEAGKAQIKKCTACHTFEKGGKDGVGPNQWGLFGSIVGHKTDYSYSDAIKELHDKGVHWNEQELSEFLKKPKKFAPGNKMSFAGIKKPEDRANLIAYLKTLR